MRCPMCNSKQSKVYDTRYTHRGYKRHRNRECECGHRFATIEILQDDFVALKAKPQNDYSDHIERIRQIVNEKV